MRYTIAIVVGGSVLATTAGQCRAGVMAPGVGGVPNGGGLIRSSAVLANVKVTKENSLHEGARVRGNFSHIFALAETNGGLMDDDAGGANAGYALDATYETITCSSGGTAYSATAKTKATVSALSASEISWHAAGTEFSVQEWPAPVPPDHGKARWAVRDPATFDVVAGETIRMTYAPGGEWSYHIDPTLLQAPGLDVSVRSFGDFGVSLPGLGELMSWSVGMSSGAMGMVDVMFSSHASLGLDDEAIEQSIRDRFSFDEMTGDLTFNAAGFSLSGSFVVPGQLGGDPFELTVSSGAGGEIGAAVVPAPGPAALATLGLTLAASRRRRQSIRASASAS